MHGGTQSVTAQTGFHCARLGRLAPVPGDPSIVAVHVQLLDVGVQLRLPKLLIWSHNSAVGLSIFNLARVRVMRNPWEGSGSAVRVGDREAPTWEPSRPKAWLRVQQWASRTASVTQSTCD